MTRPYLSITVEMLVVNSMLCAVGSRRQVLSFTDDATEGTKLLACYQGDHHGTHLLCQTYFTIDVCVSFHSVLRCCWLGDSKNLG